MCTSCVPMVYIREMADQQWIPPRNTDIFMLNLAQSHFLHVVRQVYRTQKWPAAKTDFVGNKHVHFFECIPLQAHGLDCRKRSHTHHATQKM